MASASWHPVLKKKRREREKAFRITWLFDFKHVFSLKFFVVENFHFIEVGLVNTLELKRGDILTGSVGVCVMRLTCNYILV